VTQTGSKRSLSESSFGLRLAITLLLAVLGGGFAAAAGYMVDHHSNRDGREGLSYDDIQGVYSGVRSVAPLRVALEADHPKEIEGAKALEAAPKKVLLEWLDSGKLSQQYDNSTSA
jgi:hypothetical protein